MAASTGLTNGIITTTPDGCFDFSAWEQQIRAYEGMDLQDYIDNGTFGGVIILDDLGNFTDEGPDSATLDQMAGVIKEVFNIRDEQNFPIIVRHDATDMLLKHSGHHFQHLNRVYVQITDIKAGGRRS